MFTALLDTSVLWPSTQRDFLLSLAIENLYRPIWSAAILEELQYHEEAKLARIASAKDAPVRVRHLVDEMRRAFDDAEVEGWEGFEGTYHLPDPDDEHIVAAAVVGGAGAIVTANFKDFPAVCLPTGLEVLSVAEFALNTVSLDPGKSLRAVDEMASRSGHAGPLLTVENILELLVVRYCMDEAVAVLRELLY